MSKTVLVGNCPECGGPWRQDPSTRFGVKTCGHEFSTDGPTTEERRIAAIERAIVALTNVLQDMYPAHPLTSKSYQEMLNGIRDSIAPPLARSNVKHA